MITRRPWRRASAWGTTTSPSTSRGIYGGLSMSRDEQGQTWLYVPMYGPPSEAAPDFPYNHGATPDGSVMAFKVVGSDKPTLEPVWISGNYRVPDPVAIANGIAFVLETGEKAHTKGASRSAHQDRGLALDRPTPRMRFCTRWTGATPTRPTSRRWQPLKSNTRRRRRRRTRARRRR